MDNWDSVLDRELYFIVLALILAFGILQTTGTVLSTEKPVVSVVSCSMYPEYDRGDVLIVGGVDFDSINEGQIIVYKVPMEASITIDGESFELGEESIQTSIGSGRVVNVEDSDAVLEFDGQQVKVIEGRSYTVNSANVEINEVSGMNIPVVHRVTEKRDDSLETKGDANPRQLDFETDIKPDQIHGQVFLKIPKIGAVKLIAMDLVGLSGQPLTIDSYSSCR